MRKRRRSTSRRADTPRTSHAEGASPMNDLAHDRAEGLPVCSDVAVRVIEIGNTPELGQNAHDRSEGLPVGSDAPVWTTGR